MQLPRSTEMKAVADRAGIESLQGSTSRAVHCAGMFVSAACRVCYIICDIILFTVLTSHYKSLQDLLTHFLTPETLTANRCVLLQALASSKNG